MTFRFYHELEEIYRHFCNRIAKNNLSEREMSNLIQKLMRSRQASLNQLVATEELHTYFKLYPDDN